MENSKDPYLAKRQDYLMKSPYKEDFNEQRGEPEDIGMDPRTMSAEKRLAGMDGFGWKDRPGKAIRAFCMDCVGENVAEVRKCVAVKCPLWPHRMGVNTLHPHSLGVEGKDDADKPQMKNPGT